MARFLIGSIPFVGHVGPILPIARGLVCRGHEVRWYTGARFRERVEATGATYVPMRHAPDFDDRDIDASFPARRRLRGVRALKYDIEHIFGDSAVGQTRDFLEILPEFPADVLLADSAFMGARWAHEKGGPPWAVYNSLPVTLSSRDTAPFGLGLPPAGGTIGHIRNRALQSLFTNVLFRDTIKYVDALRTGLGLPPTREFVMDAALSPYLYLQGTVESFEYPRSDLPSQVHFVGPVLPVPPADFALPSWWHELESGNAIVHVTQGTVATDAGQLLAPTLNALASEDVLVVATTGGKPVDSLGALPIPANARIEPFIPHACLLPFVDAMVTNGGYNGVQMALANGVPLVAAGRSEDKPEVCRRIAWAGVGVDLKTSTPREDGIRRAVRAVLDEPRYRHNAEKLAREFARHDAAGEAAGLLEELAATGRPVLRDRQPGT